MAKRPDDGHTIGQGAHNRKPVGTSMHQLGERRRRRNSARWLKDAWEGDVPPYLKPPQPRQGKRKKGKP